MSGKVRILIYLLRRDLRLADNPIFTEIARLNKQSQKPFTHLLPLYVFPAEQVEISGFIPGSQPSPYKEARSQVGGFWRCGRLRAKFLAESVWDLKKDLENAGSGLKIRVGSVKDAVASVLEGYGERQDAEVHAVWMTGETSWEEHEEQRLVEQVAAKAKVDVKIWHDEKYLVDDRDLPFKSPRDLSDVFTNYRKTVEPLQNVPRKELPRPQQLPPLPDFIPSQAAPFEIPESLPTLIDALIKPILKDDAPNMPDMPQGVESAHPFIGGSKSGLQRVRHLITSGSMTKYKDTRNGLLGQDFSTKLSAWLALGSVTARQVHWLLVAFEQGTSDLGKGVEGYGKGENKGTAAVRFELLWRDYMRLCTMKFGPRLFYLDGYRQDQNAKFKLISKPYSSEASKPVKDNNNAAIKASLDRFLNGTTGTGLIDASQRELHLTGWTSNRARQNVASYLTKHLGIDWRIGAEWYEMNLIDYDVHSNWGNWQYVAGVGNDPRGQARVFNPVKQAMDYDGKGEYVKAWVPELRDVGKGAGGHQDSPENLMGVFQAWRLPEEEKKRLGLAGVEWVEKPLVKIDYSVNRRGGGQKRGGGGGGGGGPYRGRGSQGRGGGGRSRGQRGGGGSRQEAQTA